MDDKGCEFEGWISVKSLIFVFVAGSDETISLTRDLFMQNEKVFATFKATRLIFATTLTRCEWENRLKERAREKRKKQVRPLFPRTFVLQISILSAAAQRV